MSVPSVADIFLRLVLGSVTPGHVTVAGGYWIGQVPDLLTVVRPRETVDSGFESWHSGLLVTSACGKNNCSVPQFLQSV